MEAGVVRLWEAVLLDAMRLAQRSSVPRWHAGAHLDALAWILNEADDPYSCRWVCDQAGRRIVDVRAIVVQRIPIPQRREAA